MKIHEDPDWKWGETIDAEHYLERNNPDSKTLGLCKTGPPLPLLLHIYRSQ